MNKLLFILLACTLTVTKAEAQPVETGDSALTLDECQKLAHENYPVVRQYRLIEQSRDFTLSNAAKAWLPKLSVEASAYAFTDILESNPAMKQMGVDMDNALASASLTIRQTVYDGGQTAAQREVIAAQSEVQKHQLDISLHALRERVEQIFFGILLLDEQLRQCDLLLNDFSASEQTVQSLIRNGLATQSDHDALCAERLKVFQQKEALLASRKAYVRMLSVFTGRELAEDVSLQKPASVSIATSVPSSQHPELLYYASLDCLADAKRKQLRTRLLPTVALFGTGMTHTQVSSLVHQNWLAAGVSLSWNIGALYTRRNDLRKLDVERATNDVQRATFLFNNRLQNEQSAGVASSLRKQIAHDEEMVRLRESIYTASRRKAELGTESVNELLRQLIAVGTARSQKALHELQLLKETYNQKHINDEE